MHAIKWCYSYKNSIIFPCRLIAKYDSQIALQPFCFSTTEQFPAAIKLVYYIISSRS